MCLLKYLFYFCQERRTPVGQDLGYAARSLRPSSPVRLFPSTVGLTERERGIRIMIFLSSFQVRLQEYQASRPHTHGANCSLILGMQTNLPTNKQTFQLTINFPILATGPCGCCPLAAFSALTRTTHVTGAPLPDVGAAVHDSDCQADSCTQ